MGPMKHKSLLEFAYLPG